MTTEQPPSAESDAEYLAGIYCSGHSQEWKARCARAINILCSQRVSAETERCAGLCDERYQELGWDDEAVGRRQECATLERRIRAPAEGPAPPQQRVCDGGMSLGEIGEFCPKCGATDSDLCAYIGDRPPGQQDSPRRIGVEQPTQQTGQPGCGMAETARSRAASIVGTWQDLHVHLYTDAALDDLELRIAHAPRDTPSALASTGDCPVSGNIVRWGVLRLLSGDLASDEERVDAELDLDDFQFWFQENPKHTGFRQILINLSGAQWAKLKELPLVEERSPQPAQLASTGEQPAPEGPNPFRASLLARMQEIHGQQPAPASTGEQPDKEE